MHIVTVTSINIGRLLQRPGLALVNILGVASVVGVMISLLALGQGVVKMATANQNPARVLVLSATAGSEYVGAIPASAVSLIADAPGVRRDARGHPLVQPQAFVAVELKKTGNRGASAVPFRGTGPAGWEMSSTIHLVAGRMYRAGLHELIAGRGLQRQFDHLNVGDKIVLRGGEWTVVGVFEDGGGIGENALVSDAQTILSAFDRPAYQSVSVQLVSPAAMPAFRRALADNPQLNLKVEFYGDYYRKQMRQLINLLYFIGYFIGAVMALGVVFGAVTMMYAAVDGRTRDYATLRALGFRGGTILASVVIESLLIAIPGLLLGVLIAWAISAGRHASIEGFSFSLAFSPALFAAAAIVTLVIGMVGGLAPGVRAARLPIATALRAT